MAASLTVPFSPDLLADFEARLDAAALRLEAVLPSGVGLATDLDLDSGPGLALAASLDTTALILCGLRSELRGAWMALESFVECPAVGLDMEEASVAPKLEGADEAIRAAVGAAGAVAGMRIASTCIGVPRNR